MNTTLLATRTLNIRLLTRSVLAVVLMQVLGSILAAQTFSRTDKLIILVKGNTLSTSMFGFSGSASLFQSVGTNADGTIQFSPVPGAQDVR
jgi:hypothetical protein